MREPLTDADLLELDLEHADASPAVAKAFATRLVSWAADPHPEDEPLPVHLLLLAGQHFEYGEDDEAAERAFRQAADLAPEDLQPRVFLTSLLIRKGRVDEALPLERELRRSRPQEVSAYLLLGEAWHERGDHLRALGWYNRGLEQAERHDGISDGGIDLLCNGRLRVRQAMGQAPDEYDEVGLSVRAAYADGD
ncbi:tetratricopeptide repeat protein [Ornithinimicrobium cavernae]|uniref:tetratricopeptide repeat protein n=1 Tax=Ornithinimicrobium cavernae TaxID=2666047 RepID=UPI000D6984D9|nr:tetratricopeptide repeat protein [Ornithinimicrobium cavernae]